MNASGHRDPTAEAAVRNVSNEELTYKKLIKYCRSRPEFFPCYNCKYFGICNIFLAETGHLPVTADPEENDKEFLDTTISNNKRRTK